MKDNRIGLKEMKQTDLEENFGLEYKMIHIR